MALSLKDWATNENVWDARAISLIPIAPRARAHKRKRNHLKTLAVNLEISKKY
jgi:hypothetical protein